MIGISPLLWGFFQMLSRLFLLLINKAVSCLQTLSQPITLSHRLVHLKCLFGQCCYLFMSCNLSPCPGSSGLGLSCLQPALHLQLRTVNLVLLRWRTASYGADKMITFYPPGLLLRSLNTTKNRSYRFRAMICQADCKQTPRMVDH